MSMPFIAGIIKVLVDYLEDLINSTKMPLSGGPEGFGKSKLLSTTNKMDSTGQSSGEGSTKGNNPREQSSGEGSEEQSSGNSNSNDSSNNDVTAGSNANNDVANSSSHEDSNSGESAPIIDPESQLEEYKENLAKTMLLYMNLPKNVTIQEL